MYVNIKMTEEQLATLRQIQPTECSFCRRPMESWYVLLQPLLRCPPDRLVEENQCENGTFHVAFVCLDCGGRIAETING